MILALAPAAFALSVNRDGILAVFEIRQRSASSPSFRSDRLLLRS
jgi:hypothetical protein